MTIFTFALLTTNYNMKHSAVVFLMLGEPSQPKLNKGTHVTMASVK